MPIVVVAEIRIYHKSNGKMFNDCKNTQVAVVSKTDKFVHLAVVIDTSKYISNILSVDEQREFILFSSVLYVILSRMNCIFSPEPIPVSGKADNIPVGKLVCIILFRRKFLLHHNSMVPALLDIAE